MKKYISMLLLGIGLSSGLWAQQSIVTGAAIEFDSKNFESAITEINKALQKPELLKPNVLAKAYVIRGKSSLEILQKGLRGDKKLLEKFPDLAEKAYDDFEKAKQNDEKGTFKDQMNMYRPLLAQALLIRSNELIAEKNFAKAGDLANKSDVTYKSMGQDFYTVHIIKGSIKLAMATTKDSVAAVSDLEAGLASFDKSLATAKDAKAKEELLKDASIPQVYAILITLYGRSQKNITKAMEVATKAKEKFPNDESIKRAELDLYLMPDLFDKALAKFEEETKKNPNDITAQLAYAGLLEKKAESLEKGGHDPSIDAQVAQIMTKAMDVYKIVLAKDLSKDPRHASLANYNMGALQNNMALRMNAKMNDAKEDDDYNRYKAEKKKYLIEAYKYMEKAYSIDPKALGTVNALVTICANLNTGDADTKIYADKFTEYKRKQQELGGGE